MFITGQGAAIETILKEETDFPFIDFINKVSVTTDSVVNVRFINLSPNSSPVKIKIANAANNEIDNLSYKTIGNWKAYPARLSSTTYAFQVRDATTDALLASLNLVANASTRFKSITLIVKGLRGTTGGANAFGILRVNYY